MRRVSYIILLAVLCQVTLNMSAQTVGYSHELLSSEGCEVNFSVTKQDTSYYIITTVRSDRMSFLKEPTMKIRTSNDDVLTFSGVVIDNSSESYGFMTGNMVIPFTEKITIAQFKVSPTQFEKLDDGVAKIRLTMAPTNHERTFKKDKIGKKLYQFYLKAKNQDDDF